MSKNLKSRHYGQYINRRNKLSENASNCTILVELYNRDELDHNREYLNNENYLQNRQKTPEAYENAKKTRCYSFCPYKPIRFECRGKLAKSYTATHQKDTRFKTHKEIRIFNKILQSTIPTDVRIQSIKCSSGTPLTTPSFHTSSMQNNNPTEDTLKQNHNLNKTFTDLVLPEKNYSKYNTKQKPCEDHSMVSIDTHFGFKVISSQHLKFPINDNKSKINSQKLCTQSNQSGAPESVAPSTIIQTYSKYEQFQARGRLPTTKDYIRPYEKTVTVYTAQKLCKPKRKKESIYCGSNNAFRLKFYKSMGDGRCCSNGGFSFKQGQGGPMSRYGPGYMRGDGGPMYGNGPGFRGGNGRPMRNGPGYRDGNGQPMSIDGPAYISSNRPAICKNGMILIPKGYSVTRLRRDEDGCICTDIPVADYGFGNIQTRNRSFMKRYFQVLMNENKRCICGKRNKRHVCPYPTYKRNMNNVGCQCKCKNPEKTGFGNDAACQCKYKEKREPRPDRESFLTERGLTCCVPITPTECSRCSFEHKMNPSSKRQEEIDRRTVNIGSNFSLKLGFYKGANYKPVCTTPCVPNPDDSCCMPAGDEPNSDSRCPSIPACCETNSHNSRYVRIPACGDSNPDSSCSCSNISANRNYFLKQFCSSPKLNCKSKTSSTQSRGSLGGSCRCSSKPSKESICCCPPPPIKRCYSTYSPCQIPYELCPSKQKLANKSKNKAVGCCRCDSKRSLIDSLNKKKSVGNCCSTCMQPICTESKHSKKTKNAACRCCSEKPILVECTNHLKDEKCGPCCSKRKKKKSKFSRIKNTACHCNIKPIIIKCTNKEKGAEICCSKCKRPKKTNENDGFCCCDDKKEQPKAPSTSKLGILSKTTGRFRKKKNVSKDPTSTKDAQCSCSYQNKIEGNFDYRSVLRSIAFTSRAQKRQCACKNGIDYKKKFGRLILFNVQDQACCSSETCGLEDSRTPLYRNVGIGDADLRKPPCLRKVCPNKKGQTSLKLKKIFYRLIKHQTCVIKQRRVFDPLNQSEAAVQHIGSDDQNERLGREVVYRDQGSNALRCKPVTLKDYETNPAYAPAEPVDPNQKTIRLGSSCSFCVELYRGPPPSKTARANVPCGDCPPCIPCPPKSAAQQQSSTENYETPCEECADPTNEALLYARKAFNTLLLRKKKHVANKTTTCQKCNKCVKVPLIKRSFANVILKDAKQRRATRMCQQKTNTVSPICKIVKRRPGNTGPGNGKPNCDPYVCLKRINQGKCCNKR